MRLALNFGPYSYVTTFAGFVALCDVLSSKNVELMAELLEWCITGSRSNVPPVGSGGCLHGNSRPKSSPISYQGGPT